MAAGVPGVPAFGLVPTARLHTAWRLTRTLSVRWRTQGAEPGVNIAMRPATFGTAQTW